MKNILFFIYYPKVIAGLFLSSLMLLVFSCKEDDDMPDTPDLTGDSETYTLNAVSDSAISGNVKFEEMEEGGTLVTIDLNGTSSGIHPAHIHVNSAAEGGGIIISLEAVDGSTGMSVTEVTELDTGTAISYDELIEYDGYVNVHLSEEDLSTLIAQGDIGGNALTGNSKTYNLEQRAVEGISGTVTFEERNNGLTLATIQLEGTSEGGEHPAHIHENSAAEGGPIAISFNPVDGTTGMSKTTIRKKDGEGGEAITYEDILNYNGYVNVHLSPDDLPTIVAQGDIGANELTGESKTYNLEERAVEGISGTVTFAQRKSGFTLATIQLEGTPTDGMHPAHIHDGAATDMGPIAISFNPVNGTTGMSMTTIRKKDGDGGEEITYEDLLNYNGYVNVHLDETPEGLATIIAQGDIGANELTGESVTYNLEQRAVEGVSGMVTFAQRKNGSTLATIQLEGTAEGIMHPAHIHNNSAAEGGPIAISFNPVDGTTGMSKTTIRTLDEAAGGEEITYEALLDYDGYVNVHLDATQEGLATIIAQGDIGGNELTEESTTYTLNEKDVPSVNGTVTFTKRKNGFTLAIIQLEGTADAVMHPAHIHDNSAEEGGPIAVSFTPVNGTTGMSVTTIRKKDGEDGAALTYDDIITYDGYVNVHLSAEDLATLIAQGNIGSNAQ